MLAYTATVYTETTDLRPADKPNLYPQSPIEITGQIMYFGYLFNNTFQAKKLHIALEPKLLQFHIYKAAISVFIQQAAEAKILKLWQLLACFISDSVPCFTIS